MSGQAAAGTTVVHVGAISNGAATPIDLTIAPVFTAATLQGLIAATSEKGSGLAEPTADAINHLIQNGDYGKWPAAWNLSSEAVRTSQVNPPGLPLTNS